MNATLSVERNSPAGPTPQAHGLSAILSWMLLSAAFASASEGEAGWVEVPGRWAPGEARLRVEAAGVPLSFSIPAAPSSEGRAEFEVARGIRLALEDPPAGEAGPKDLRALVLRPPEAGTVKFVLEVRIPGLESAVPARLELRGSEDVALLSVRGGGEQAAWGYYDPRTDRGLDLGGCAEGIRLSSRVFPPTEAGAGFRLVSIEGRVPRGREVVLFSWRWKDRVLSARWRDGAGTAVDSPAAADGAAGLWGSFFPGDQELGGWVEKLLSARPFPHPHYVEIGDGWQRGRRARLFKGPSRDWLAALAPQGGEAEETGSDPGGEGDRGGRRREVFPAARKLVEAGFPVGLWIVPHGQGDEAVFQARPSAFVRTARGEPIPDAFLGRFVVDGTREEGRAYLSDLLRALRAQGIRIFRLGGLKDALAFYGSERGNLGNPSPEPLEVLESTLAALRAGAGPDALLLGDVETPEVLLGLLDASLPSFPAGAGLDPLWLEGAAAARGYFRHRLGGWVECFPALAWATRQAEPPPSDRSRVLFAALTGRGILRDGTKDAPGGIRDLLRSAWPVAPVRPLDLFPRKGAPRIWVLDCGEGAGVRTLAGIFNWSTLRPAQLALAPADLGLPASDGESYMVFDVLAKAFVGSSSGQPLDFWLRPGESRLFSVAAHAGRPQVVGASGRFLASALDVGDVRWDERALELRGLARCASGEPELPRTLDVHLACGFDFGVLGAEADGAGARFRASGDHAVVSFDLPRPGEFPFCVRFGRRGRELLGAAAAVELAAPRDLKVAYEKSERKPLLSWSGGEDGAQWWLGIAGFSIFRDGVEIGRSTEGRFLDATIGWGASPGYSVRALPSGSGGTPRDPAKLTTASVGFFMPPARTAYLDGLSAAGLAPEDRPPARRRSFVGGALQVGGRKFERGLGTHAPSRIDYALDGGYDRFEAFVGVDDAARLQGSVVFVVQVDGAERYRSDTIRGGGGEPLAIRVSISGGRVLSLIAEDAGDGREADLADWLSPLIVAPATRLERAHSHNDYRKDKPLLDALELGFASVEADIFLVDGKLLVGHDRSELKPERTLDALYLDPLLERVRKGGGSVYPGGGELYLLIDIKTEGEKVYGVLRETLSRYAEMLTRFEKGRVEVKAVTVILSGDCPRNVLAAEESRHAAADGRLPDLDAAEPASASLVPLVSHNWRSAFKWWGIGEMPDREREKLREIVGKSHAQGRKLRFWGTPDLPAVWKELLSAGVDLLNADDLPALARFLVDAED